MILVAVGTFLKGFDELVLAADLAASHLDIAGFAQIGHGGYLPSHLTFERFLAPDALIERIRRSDLVVSHAGMGLVGDVMRCGVPLIVVPRRGPTRAANPANDQMLFARRLACEFGVTICADPATLEAAIRTALGRKEPPGYAIRSNVPDLIARYLGRHDAA